MEHNDIDKSSKIRDVFLNFSVQLDTFSPNLLITTTTKALLK